ncbi:hypothetical protein KP509_12G006500 [Ceratopteris richardii]|uniref:U2A'/phosphoprotein 32 family A C-terminal domain-containing protein n=1 Tax=Ceratopteris richardii TaxID=49495 RepID=A0A8T2TID8_CERRI|nr:hypothetical protein KP509_12G006500 [Ceratopteris richardii]
MVRLTADLILRSFQFFNAVREREIDLRGNKIAVIENLGATEDQFDSIDLSDNEIVKLEGFPYLKRLTTLLVSNNRIARINPNIGGFLPKLHTLILTNNRLVNLVDLDPLAALVNLQTLSLLDNVVTKKTHYRLYVIHKLPKLRILDFRKIKQRERQEATALFGSKEAEALKEANTFVPGELPEEKPAPEPVQVQQTGPTPEQILAIKAAIASSQTLDEVARLEKALKSGQLPADLRITDDDNTTKKLSELNMEKVQPDQSLASSYDTQNDIAMADESTDTMQATENGPDNMDQG